jgi:Flp pilus assembly protein TadG
LNNHENSSDGFNQFPVSTLYSFKMFFAYLQHCLKSFLSDRSGQFALMFAILSPVAFGVAGGVVDLVIHQKQQALLKTTADIASLAAAKEATLKGWSQATAEEVVKAVVNSNIEGKSFSKDAAFATLVTVNEAAKSVKVDLDMDHHSYFVLGYFHKNPQIHVSSTARAAGETSLCVISLEGSASSAMRLGEKGKLTAADCAVHSNSKATDGLASTADAVLSAAVVCSAGGFKGAPKNYARVPTTDCTPIEDPLSSRKPAKFEKCDFLDTVVKHKSFTLQPGTYCNGILIDNQADVTFAPGDYIIKDGEFRVRNSGQASGKGVSFFFTGKKTSLEFDGTTIVDFEAPETGPMAGILFFEDPKSPEGTIYEISAKRAANLLGTIYLPKGTLKIHAQNKVAEESAYTVIVANKIDIGKFADVVINSDYGATAVPVPDGLGGANRTIVLAE